jgi:uncharacterized membrane protein
MNSSTSHSHAPVPLGPRGISVHGNRGFKVVRACRIQRPAADLYAACRDLDNLQRILGHPVTITRVEGSEPRWRVRVPVGGRLIEWDATIINDEPDRLIAWRSLEGAPVPNAGTIRFEPVVDGSGTTVTLQMEYDPPGGRLTAFFAELTGQGPESQVTEALQRFKELMESEAIIAPGAGR